MGRVLVLDADARHGLVAIRSLGKRGLSVTAGSTTQFNAGSLSKYVSRRLQYPSPATDTAEFLRIVEHELASREYDMLLPVNQATVDIVARSRGRFEPHTVVPFPPNETLEFGLDKGATVRAAREAGVPCPKSILTDAPDLDRAAEELGYPIVVKPRRGSDRSGVSVCHSRRELERAYRETTERHGPVLLQEFVPYGGERGVYTLYDDAGRLVRVTVQRRLRSNPPEGGASTYRETVSDPKLVEQADDLLSGIGWSGVAMAEFRVDERTGEAVLMEINPRLWGSLALSVFAGVDFPYHLYRQAMGEAIERDLNYAVGVRARFLFTDALQVMAREDRLHAAYEFLRPSEKPCCFDVLSWDDPLPTLGQFLYYAGVLRDRRRGSRTTDQRPSAQGQEEVTAETGR